MTADLPPGIDRRRFDGRERFATRGEPVYGEPQDGAGWRPWDAGRSKLGAMLELGMDVGFDGGDGVLYLGAASGTTVSSYSKPSSSSLSRTRFEYGQDSRS